MRRRRRNTQYDKKKIKANKNDHMPWPDRYGIHSFPSDVVGVDNLNVTSHLLDLVGGEYNAGPSY